MERLIFQRLYLSDMQDSSVKIRTCFHLIGIGNAVLGSLLAWVVLGWYKNYDKAFEIHDHAGFLWENVMAVNRFALQRL